MMARQLKNLFFSATYTQFLLVPFLDILITMYKLDRVRKIILFC